MNKLYITALLMISFNFSVLAMKNTKQEVLNLKLATAFLGQQEIDWKKIESILTSGADVEYKPWGNNTLLYIFAGENNIEFMKNLIELGANINSRNSDDETPLHYASKKGHLEAVNMLINNGADINAVNKKGNTSLHLAAKKGKKNIVKFITTLPVFVQNFNQCQSCNQFNKAILKYTQDPNAFNHLSGNEQIQFMQIVQERHLSAIKQTILFRNNNGCTVIDLAYRYAMEVLYKGKEAMSEFMYLYNIEHAKKYEELDQELKNQVENNYQKAIYPPDYWNNKEKALVAKYFS